MSDSPYKPPACSAPPEAKGRRRLLLIFLFVVTLIVGLAAISLIQKAEIARMEGRLEKLRSQQRALRLKTEEELRRQEDAPMVPEL